MFRLVRKFRSGFLILMASVAAAGIFEVSQPLWLGRMIDRSFLGGAWSSLPFYGGMFFLFLAASQLFRFFETRIIENLSAEIGSKLRTDFWRRISQSRISDFSKKKPGEWTALFLGDIQTFQNYFVEGIASLASHGVFLIGIVIVSAVIDMRILILFAVALLLFLATFPLKQFYLSSAGQTLSQQEKLYGFLNEILANEWEIRQFRMEKTLEEEASVLSQSFRRAKFHQARLGALFPLVTESLAWFLMASVLGFGGIQVLEGKLSIGLLVVFLDYARRFFSPLREMTERWNRFQNAVAAWRRLEEAQSELGLESQSRTSFPGLEKEICFRNVRFSYDPESLNLMDHLNLTFRAGEKVAIAGPSGAGKSTLLKLLLSLYPTEAGEISIDEVSITEWAPGSLRSELLWFSGDWKEDIPWTQMALLEGKTLLLDEIEKQLDPDLLSEFLERVLANPNLTVIWISHQDKVLQSFPRVIHLNQGRIVDDVIDRRYESKPQPILF